MMVWKQKASLSKIRGRNKTLLQFPYELVRNTVLKAVPSSLKNRWLLFTTNIVTLIAVLLAMPAVVLAGGLTSSSNYELGEAFFGAGGQLETCSSNYCSKTSIGELAVGDATSANYQAHAGFNTDRSPYIQITVSNTNANLGKLTPSSTKTTRATFSVEAYLSHGYTVTNASPPPTNGSYTMQTPSTPTASTPGTEQFGINLVANTYPTTFGANPVYAPDASFSNGQVGSSYDTSNLFMYNQGDTIAYSTASSSFTIYTISYIFNISNVTPGGTYTFNHVLVATGTY